MSDPDLSAAELDALEAMEREATPGEWRTHECDDDQSCVRDADLHVIAHCHQIRQRADAALIAALRNAAPRLIAAVRTLATSAAREASLLTAARSVISALEAIDAPTLSGPQGVTVWQAVQELRKAVGDGDA